MQQIVTYLAIGLAAGMLSGFLGIGGGLLIVPALVLLLGFSQHTAQGTSLALLSFPIGLIALINYHKAGMVNYKAAIFMVMTFVIGSYFASKVAVTLPENIVKKVFAVLLLAYSIKLFTDK
jgi:uncharacterized membrane protein YfcA